MTTTDPVPAGTRCDTSGMLHAHGLLRRAFVDAPVLVRGVEDGDRGRADVVASHVREMAGILHRHHESEDLLLWDTLERRAPACALHVGLMRSQHATVATLLRRLDVALPTWTAGAAAEGRERVAEVLDEIRAALLAHLGSEESAILPTASTVMSQQEWDGLAEHGRRATPGDRLLLHLGWLLDSLPEAERDGWVRTNLPAPLRLAWRLVGRRRFAAHRARVYGGTLS